MYICNYVYRCVFSIKLTFALVHTTLSRNTVFLSEVIVIAKYELSHRRPSVSRRPATVVGCLHRDNNLRSSLAVAVFFV